MKQKKIKTPEKNVRDNNEDDDQLRGNTMNETLREASGDPDMDLNELREDTHSPINQNDRDEYRNADLDQGISYTPNDASAVRSGGISDMDDQTISGAGAASSRRGSNLTSKKAVTGSDYDGQNSTS